MRSVSEDLRRTRAGLLSMQQMPAVSVQHLSSGQAVSFAEDEGLRPVGRTFPECTGLQRD